MTDLNREAAELTDTSLSRWQPYPEYKDSGVEWLGDIPSTWNTFALKWSISIQSGEFLSNEEIEIHQDEEHPIPVIGGNGINGYTHLINSRENTIVIGRVGALCGNVHLIRDKSWVTDNALKLSNIQYFEISFLEDLLHTLNLNRLATSTAQPLITSRQVKSLIVPVPPLSEQHAIATFLDRETAEIDALIAKKRELITLLQEQRSALISHAVTKGLNPDAPMKDSGIEWLGEIPEHWEILSLSQVVTKFVDYRGHTPQKVDDGIPLITARNIDNGQINMELSREYMPENMYDSWMVRGFPEIGDVLITTEAPLGGIAQIIDTNIALAQRLILLKRNREKMTNEYLKYYLLSTAGQGELWSRATGSTAIGIKASRLKQISVVVPPPDEQVRITEAIDQAIDETDPILNKVTETITYLQEYRSALISAAITGKIDVR